MADLPLLIGASLGHFKYTRSQATCQQKHDIKLHKNKPFILDILYNAILAALVDVYGAKYARAIRTYGNKEKPANGPSAGL